MIVVTGATGNVGRPLVRALVEAGEEVTAVSRRLSERDVPAGVAYRQVDLLEPEDLKSAAAGADAVFLLTSGEFLGRGGDLRQVLDALRSGGVPRVVLLSSQGVGTGHHPSALEDAVTESSLQWTVLRPGNFASNALQWAETVRTQRAVFAPFGDIAVPTIDPDDIAAVAATALLDAAHAGRVYELTGPAPITPRQQAAAIAGALGEPVRFVEQTRAEARTQLVRFMPEPIADVTLDVLGDPPAALRRVSPDVERILGRPAGAFADWAARNAAAFA